MDYEKLADLIDELGRLGSIGKDGFSEYLHSSGRDGDTYVQEGLLQLGDVTNELDF